MKFIIVFFSAFLFAGICNAQLVITDEPSAVALAQKLVGDGVTISNVSFTGNSLMAARFNNVGNLANINIDSGIVLTTGRAKTVNPNLDQYGLDGDGTTIASSIDASTLWGLPGDADLANAIGANVSDLNDACVLEFDFIPSGDSVKFRYVFSSEEYYPGFVCTYNDAFAFFISGPGIPGVQNIALVPNTTTPVSIFNVNNVTGVFPANCINNPSYYIDNTNNQYLTHEGHTVVLTAYSAVTPCNVYHLKLVVSDFTDEAYDTGVFLEAKSLTSNIVTLTNNTQTDNSNNSYIVEGCMTGSFTIKRPNHANYPLAVQLTYGGTAVNGVDMLTLPSTVVIPANDSMVTVDVIPIVDNIPEGIEYIKVYAGAGCGSVAPIDSAIIQIRDYDTLSIVPPGNSFICKDGSLQLQATSNPTTTYQWNSAAGLNNYTISDPVATPTQSGVTYICTATLGACNQRDSVFIQWKELEFNSQANVNCHGASTGQITVSGGPEWNSPPVEYSINNLPSQPGGTFNNLSVGDYMVHITDASGCKDSIPVSVTQAYPDLLITNTQLTPASCAAADGSITVTAGGGLAPYQYSIDGTTFQTGNVFNAAPNTFTITVNDANNCTTVLPGVVVPYINDLTLTASHDTAICSGRSATLTANSTATTYTWAPTTGLSNPNSQTTVATPTVNTTYTVTATLGACEQTALVNISIDDNLTVDAGGPLYIDAGGSAQVLAVVGGTNTNISSILWTGSAGLSATNILNPVITVPGASGTATYNITVTNTSGCSASDELLVNIVPNCIKLRNAFTPNGDGNNDLWLVYDDYSCLKNVTVHVFNRYGSKIFESQDYRNTWDGRYKGKPVPDATYYAIVEYTLLSGRVKTVKTDLTILR